MSVSNLNKNVAYGLSQALLGVPPSQIISKRSPTTADKAPVGQEWVNIVTNQIYFLAGIANNLATWNLMAAGGGSGVFSSVEATTGNITADLGNIVATAGSVSAGTTVHATTAVSAGTTVTAGTGITATTGNITATTGSVVVTAGNVTANGTGAVIAAIGTGGLVKGTSLSAAGDVGTGSSGTTQFTNAVDTTQSSGTLSILSASANNGDNAGFLKIYVGTVVAYVPYFTTVAP
jgi:hypothetical protein